MSDERQHHESSSSDSVAAQIPSEKPPVEQSSSPQDQQDVTPTSEENDTENVIEKKESGSPLDRTPSQAAKMGKKKIAVVMTALCVCTTLDTQHKVAAQCVASFTSLLESSTNIFFLIYSWHCFLLLWIW